MPGLMHAHHHDWLGYLTVAGVLAVIAMAARMWLKDAARILTGWQMGGW